jgi:hypothetical protein
MFLDQTDPGSRGIRGGRKRKPIGNRWAFLLKRRARDAAAENRCPYLALIVVGFPSSPMKTTRILTGASPLLKAWCQ